MKCQLVSTLVADRRTRGFYVYPVIWARAVSRYMRWYLKLAGQALGRGSAEDWSEAQSLCRRADGPYLKAGDWVRVKSLAEIEALQQGAEISDTVAFIPAPMSPYCGRTLRVLRILEHYYDEVREGLCKAENAVLLEGATCDSSQLGSRHCDRGCLHFWKESWLERVADPKPTPANGLQQEPVATATQSADRKRLSPDPGTRRSHELQAGEAVRVRGLSSITQTLDAHGVCEGVPFIPEHMAAYCGRIFVISRKITHFFDEKADYMIRLPQASLLAGVRCNGLQADGGAQCDRGCTLVWHDTWLERAGLESVSDVSGRREDV